MIPLTRRALGSILLATALTSLVAVALLATLIPLNGLWSGDQGAKLVQVISLIKTRFTSLALVEPPGYALDPSGRFSPLPTLLTWHDTERGVFYSLFSYPYAALTAPLFFFLGFPGLFVVPLLATGGTLALGGLIGRRLGLRPAWALPPLLGLATPLGFYAMVPWEHALAVAATSGATLLLLRELGRDGPARGGVWAMAGLLAGLACWLRPETIWFGPALLAGALLAGARRPGPLLALSGGLALAVAVWMASNLTLFGAPLGPQISANYDVALEPTTTALLADQARIALTMSSGVGAWQPAWWIALAGAGAALLPLPRLRPWLLLAMGVASLAPLLATPWHYAIFVGLASACPLALLPSWLAAARPLSRELRLTSGTAAIYVVGVLLTAPNDGGASWGPRYLLPALPLLVLAGLAATWALLRATSGPLRLAAWLGLILLLITSFGVALRSVIVLRDSTSQSLRLTQVVNAQPARVIVTDAEFGPQLLAQLLYERPVLFTNEPLLPAELLELVWASGESHFALLTDTPRGQVAGRLASHGAACAVVEGFAYGLTLFDCQRTVGSSSPGSFR